MRTFETLAQLQACAGQEIAISDWIEITQEQVNLFAQATGDHQWIHVDVDKARQGPFGAPIAHGHLTLSLLPRFFQMAMQVREVRMGVNYGFDKVRFTAPVPVGSRLRGRLKLLAAEPVEQGGLQTRFLVAVEREGSEKPVCVAEAIARQYP